MNTKTDFLIIGGGITGLTLAIKLARLTPDTKILLITKENVKEGSTFYAQGGIACVWSENDSFEKHIQDTIKAGDGLCDEDIVKKILMQAPERIKDELRSEFRSEIGGSRKEFTSEISGLRNEFNSEMGSLRKELKKH